MSMKGPTLLVQFLRCKVISQPPHHIHERPPPRIALIIVQPRVGVHFEPSVRTFQLGRLR